MKTGVTPIAWFVENEKGEELNSLGEAMADMRREAPSIEFERLGDLTSGGWPVYRLTVSDDDSAFLTYLLGHEPDDV